jgi:hypothetical protein
VRWFLAVAAALLVVALPLELGVLPGDSDEGRGGPTAESAGEAEDEAGEEGLAGELAEQEEQARGREEALEQAREQGTLGLIEPLRANPAPGWVGERLWSDKADDWEPAVAGLPGSSRVYMLTTRYGGKPACGDCPAPAIRLRRSSDGGEHWGRTRYLCRCRGSKHQYDPEIEMAADGSLYAAWLDGFTPGVTFARSDDGGHNWTKPIDVDGHLRWSDKPIVAVSADGQDVYIAFNGPTAGDAHVAVSHDAGESFGQPVSVGQSSRYHFAGGEVVTPDGTVAFGQTAYRQNSNGNVRVLATTSSDGGQSWHNVKVDLMAKQPDCVAAGCPKDFYGPQAAMAGDADGNLVIVYNGATRREGPQRAYTRTSVDGGLTWSARTRISPKRADAAFPAAVGGDAGDFRVWFMDDRKGSDDRWNTWYRQSGDGGQTWSKALRISDATAGTAYVKRGGFLEPYGDYGELAIIEDGVTFAVWGEGLSYTGPGGTWFNRTK